MVGQSPVLRVAARGLSLTIPARSLIKDLEVEPVPPVDVVSHSDACEWAYRRYIKDDPEMEAYFDELEVKAGISRQIYDIRNELRMTREGLANYSGLSPQVTEDLEEADYEGDWPAAVEKINLAFTTWVCKLVVPAPKEPQEYLVKAANE